jgi:ubiquinone biosynthesis UbiH/UbiF/VisC/COQ6 family hydroxylase
MQGPGEVHVHGAGAVGTTAALALAQQGLSVVLHDSRPLAEGESVAQARGQDVRAFALNPASVALLSQLGVWSRIGDAHRTSVLDMRVRGDASNASLHFSAWQQCQTELAWIVDAQALEVALAMAVADRASSIKVVPASLASPTTDLGPNAEQDLTGPTLHVVAEGRHGAHRQRLGVAFDRHDYPQHAVAARLRATRPHHQTARQWFLAPEVLALLPVSANSYALVWSVSPERAADLKAMPQASFEDALMQVLGEEGAREVGALTLEAERATWPLAIAKAQQLHGVWPSAPDAASAWVLVGDAAHVVHPLAGQGLNLGLADVATLVDVIAQREAWRGLTDARLLARYARQRALDVTAMGLTTDALQGLFANPSPLAKALRNRGMAAVDKLGVMKRWLAGQAMGR